MRPREGAAALRRWWTALPSAFHVVRDGNGGTCGFYCMFEPGAFDRWAPVDDDPLVRQWLAHGKATPLPADQRTLLLRRWLSAEDGERPSAVQAACFLDIKRTYMELRPQLRRVYLAVRDVETWRTALGKLGFAMLPQCDVDLEWRPAITRRCSTSGRARWTGGCPGWRGTSSGSTRGICWMSADAA